MAEPYYGDFDLTPARYDGEDWVEINSASHGNAVRELSKADFESLFRGVTPLPPKAFRSASRMTEPFYGSFDGIPSRYDENEAWVFRGGDEDHVAALIKEVAAKARDEKRVASAARIEVGMREAHAVLAALPNQ